MSDPTASTETNLPAADVCRRIQLFEASRALLREGMTVPEFADALVEAEQFADAVKVVAYALPVREAIWWACQCARQRPPRGTALTAIEAAEKWVAEMTGDIRRACLPVANEAGVDNAAGCAALAVFYSGGSLASPSDAPVEPPPTAAPQLVVGSVILSAAMPESEKRAGRFKIFVGRGIELYREVVQGEQNAAR